MNGDRGAEAWQEPGGTPGEKRVGGVWKAGEEGREAGKKGKSYTTLCNILQSEKCKEAGANKIQGGNRD